MTLAEALERARAGAAVSRERWGDPNMVVHAESDSTWMGATKIATGPKVFTQEDLDADDWFVVGTIN